MKKIKKKFVIEDDIYKTKVFFFIGYTDEEFIKSMEKLGVSLKKMSEYTCGTVIRVNDSFSRAVWIDRFIQNNSEDYGVLVHELFHLITNICQDKQIPIKANIESGECGDEAAAYLLEFYTKKCFEKLLG